MDESNISDLKGEKPKEGNAKILLLGDFDPQGDRIIRDPYYVRDTFIFIYTVCSLKLPTCEKLLFIVLWKRLFV